MKKNIHKLIILFIFINCLIMKAQVDFLDHEIANNNNYGSSVSGSYASDLDNDGDLDVVTYYYEGNLVWYENIPSKGGLVKPKIIHKSTNGSNSNVLAIDIDNDGDKDIFASSDFEIFWFENIDGLGNFEYRDKLKEEEDEVSCSSLDFYDFDNDGDLDILSSTTSSNYEYKIVWFENTDGLGSFAQEKIIHVFSYYIEAMAKDVDQDGDGDIVLFKNLWIENVDGKGTFSNPQKIFSNIEEGFPVDLDSDGDLDMIVNDESSRYDKLVWYENTNGLGSVGNKKVIEPIVINGIGEIYANDIDNDGDVDILFDSKGFHYYENDGNENFVTRGVDSESSSNCSRIISADINNDGYKDILSACHLFEEGGTPFSDFKEGLAYIEFDKNINGFKKESLLSENFNNPKASVITDIDNDGDSDIIVISNGDNKVSWFEDIDGTQNFSSQHTISNTLYDPAHVIAVDIDDDDDDDIFVSSQLENKIVWYRNNGDGSFENEVILTTNLKRPYMVNASDIDKDGDLDILSGSNDGKIVLFENIDGLGSFRQQEIISTEIRGITSIYVADFDNDNNDDILVKSRGDGPNLSWYRNLDGIGNNFKEEQVIEYSSSGNPFLDIGDIDNDGDLDILVSMDGDTYLSWFENIDNKGKFNNGNIIYNRGYRTSAMLEDVDLDGDLDVITLGLLYSRVVWFENIDGTGVFKNVPKEISDKSAKGYETLLSASDIDKDGDIDVLTFNVRKDRIVYSENLKINTLSIEKYPADSFAIYPNPSNQFINIESEILINSITIYDLKGRELKKNKILKPTLNYRIDLSDLSFGMYLLEIKSKDKKETNKFIKK